MRTPLWNRRVARIFVPLGIAATAPFLFLGGPNLTSSPAITAAWNLGHIFFFGMVTVCLRQVFPPLRGQPGPMLLTIFSFGVLLVGWEIEQAQSSLQRVADWHDVWRNLLGAWLAWAALSYKSRAYRVFFGVLLFLLCVEVGIVGRIGWEHRKIQNQLPLICRLEKKTDIARWTGIVELSHEVATVGSASMRVEFGTEEYSSTELERFPRDWRGYHRLVFDTFNPNPEELQVTLRINDIAHIRNGSLFEDRFNQCLVLTSGWNRIEIELEQIELGPEERLLELNEVFGLSIFVVRQSQPQVIFLDDFRLE